MRYFVRHHNHINGVYVGDSFVEVERVNPHRETLVISGEENLPENFLPLDH